MNTGINDEKTKKTGITNKDNTSTTIKLPDQPHKRKRTKGLTNPYKKKNVSNTDLKLGKRGRPIDFLKRALKYIEKESQRKLKESQKRAKAEQKEAFKQQRAEEIKARRDERAKEKFLEKFRKEARRDYIDWWKDQIKTDKDLRKSFKDPEKDFIKKINSRLRNIYKTGLVNNDVLQEAIDDLGIDLIGKGYISTKEVLSEDTKESLEKLIKTPKKFDFEDLNKKALGQLIQDTLDDFYDFYDSSAVWTALEEKLKELMMGRDERAQQIAKESLRLIGPGTVKSMMSDVMRAFGKGELKDAKDLKDKLWNMIKQHDLYSGNLD